MYQALYRKWRPQDFDSVVGQSHITDILKNQLMTSRTSHAYLFTGTRGTGKTTCAKIMAKALNCENPQNGYCFAENFTVDENDVEEIIVYKWNRVYPADVQFNIDLKKWNLAETVDFAGSSHEKITRERYVR